MKKVHVFSVLVFAAGLLFSCGSDDPPSSGEILGQGDSSSSSGLPSGTGFCRLLDGTCTPSQVSLEACDLAGGLLVQSCSVGSSSSVALSSSSGLPSGSGFCRFSDGTCTSSPVSLEACTGFGGTLDPSCAPSSSSVAKLSSSSSEDPSGYCYYGVDNCHKMPTGDNCASGTLVPNCSVPPSSSSSVQSSSSEEASSSSEEVSSSSVGGGSPVITTFIDSRDGKTYKKVTIGTQTWMAENLNYEPANRNSVCYGNNPANCVTYGRLYDFSTANMACPSGWHLPSQAEWGVMTAYVGGATGGKKLKATNGWNSYEGVSGNGTDDYGFSALPGGGYNQFSGSGSSTGSGSRGTWWSSDISTVKDASGENSSVIMIILRISYDNDNISMSSGIEYSSVRCLQDDGTTTPTFVDSRDGKTYKKVTIGTKTWMAENLNYDVPDNTTDVCYDDLTSNCDTYGRLYNWTTAMTACPSGWHLPSDDEWARLVTIAGGDSRTANQTLRSVTGWDYSQSASYGTDDYGFSALPGGKRLPTSGFRYIGTDGWWWSTTANDKGFIWSRNIRHFGEMRRESEDTSYLQSVRCAQD